jgi:hypothetical protein
MITQATGLGPNPVGIARGSDGGTHVARFDHDGARVLLGLENRVYRGTSIQWMDVSSVSGRLGTL